MSRQINFFADEVDSAAFYAWMLGSFPGLLAITPRRGVRTDLLPVPARDCISRLREKILLTCEELQDKIVLADISDVYPNSCVVDQQKSPVLELVPSVMEDQDTVKVGRVYWAYTGTIPKAQIRFASKIFSWLRDNTVALDRVLRVFSRTSRSVKFLKPWLTERQLNPLFEPMRETHT